MSVDIRKDILSIYNDLTKPELLQKCLHGKTHESFNGMIWNRIPKTHVGLNNLSLGFYDANAHFNHGTKATLDVFELLNVDAGSYTTQLCDTLNKVHKRSSAYKTCEQCKKRRKVIRHLKKKKQDKNVENEDTSYEAGGFYQLIHIPKVNVFL